MLPPGEEEIPFDLLFGMGNISPDVFALRTAAVRWETHEKRVHSISTVGRRGRRIDVDEVDAIQRPIRRSWSCVASDLMPCHFQMRFQPLWALTVEAVCVVIPFGVETRIGDVVSSTVGMLSYCSRGEVSPLQPTFAPRGVSCGHGLHS